MATSGHERYVSAAAKARPPDAFKDIIPLMGDPTSVCLAGGAPLPSLFPIQDITVRLRDGTSIEIEGDDASRAQRYAPFAQGPILEWCKTQVQQLHNPPAAWEVQLTAGSMSAIDIVFDMVLDPGSTLLIEEFTFTAAIDAMKATRANLEQVQSDRDGMLPEALEAKCATLGEARIKPRALFIIPVGQNPTGTRLRKDRYLAIYAIACKYDFLIIEDDPYFCLQFNKQGCSEECGLPGLSLGTSFLSIDAEARVLRLDSFSKMMAPGFRLGWITGPPGLLHYYRKHCYASSQWGASLSMKVLAAIFEKWQRAGFEEFVLKMQEAYKTRRDVALAAAE
eukprot:CAMPEP_0198228508 /NCGR_PEP_ID=MMETSP1445-20131203/113433_1 /TAXON_ID=36898 /ORGANISM="Pyramimonas sp., Strain CCMP2087" /LENGTH=336 /DNA_ID=CAMNT_0043908885 /DNA_START=248 /DNA_END=1255 /DNA_ORIENTATION=-